MIDPLIELEKAIDWSNTGGTFLLPGETSIDSPTMRRRIALYYKQIRGPHNFHHNAHLAMLRNLAATLKAEAGPSPGERPPYRPTPRPPHPDDADT